MKGIFAISCISIVLFSEATGQSQQVKDNMPRPIPQSPNVASLGKYGDYPVSYFTGLPEISIPIFEVKSGSLTVPITLSYHASGIRYTEQASWVGLGWSLSAGGQISRNVAGKPDEELFYTGQLVLNPAICTNYEYIKSVALGSYDTAPDLFSYSYPGKSGKFYLRQGGLSPYLIPYEAINVIPTHASNHFQKFEITDESGNLYRYGMNGNNIEAKEATNSTNGGVGSTSYSAWHLMEMIAPNSDDKISFHYQPNGNPSTQDISYQLTIYDLCLEDNLQCPTNNLNPSVINSLSTTNQEALSSIVFEGGKVEFLLGQNRNDQAPTVLSKYLEQINIYSEVNGTFSLVKSVKFHYSYFKNTASTIDLRLKLDAVDFLSANGEVVQPYTFTYHTNNFSWDVPVNSLKRDFWGYYNGKVENGEVNTSIYGLIPRQDITFQSSTSSLPTTWVIGGANRDADTTYLAEGLLERINFPTGGYTEFKFEPHQYEDTGTKFGGGLRIKRITSSDGISTPLIKTYKYGFDESGSGVKNFFWSKYYYHNEINNVQWYDDGTVFRQCRFRSRVFFSNSMLSPDAFDGSPVLYPYVTEYYGGSVSNIGKIKYTFDDGSINLDKVWTLPSGKNYVETKFWERGKLTNKTVNDVSGKKIGETINGYGLLHSTDFLIGFISDKGINYISGPGVTPIGNPQCTNEEGAIISVLEFSYMSNNQSSGAYRQTSSVESQYDPANQANIIAKTNTNQFDNTYLQVTQSSQSSSNSSDAVVISKTRYPFSYTYTGLETGPAKGLKLLNDKHILSQPVEQYSIRSDGSNNLVTGGQVTTFKENPANAAHIVADQIYLLETQTTIPESGYQLMDLSDSEVTMDSRYQPRISFKKYDDKANITVVKKVNDMATSYLWGYNQQLPIAEIQNAEVDMVYCTSFEENGILNNLPRTGKKVWSGVYSLPVTIPYGQYKLSYWQKTGTGPWTLFEQTTTVGSGTLQPLTVGTAGNLLDEVRLFPYGAIVTTYSYEPLIGVTSQTDANNQTSFFEYDAFGRLSTVKDDKGNIIKKYSYNYMVK